MALSIFLRDRWDVGITSLVIHEFLHQESLLEVDQENLPFHL
jgi:hypothetical protein